MNAHPDIRREIKIPLPIPQPGDPSFYVWQPLCRALGAGWMHCYVGAFRNGALFGGLSGVINAATLPFFAKMKAHLPRDKGLDKVVYLSSEIIPGLISYGIMNRLYQKSINPLFRCSPVVAGLAIMASTIYGRGNDCLLDLPEAPDKSQDALNQQRYPLDLI